MAAHGGIAAVEDNPGGGAIFALAFARTVSPQGEA